MKIKNNNNGGDGKRDQDSDARHHLDGLTAISCKYPKDPGILRLPPKGHSKGMESTTLSTFILFINRFSRVLYIYIYFKILFIRKAYFLKIHISKTRASLTFSLSVWRVLCPGHRAQAVSSNCPVSQPPHGHPHPNIYANTHVYVCVYIFECVCECVSMCVCVCVGS